MIVLKMTAVANYARNAQGSVDEGTPEAGREGV